MKNESEDIIKIKLRTMKEAIEFCMKLNNSTIKQADDQLKKEYVHMTSDCYWEALQNQAQTNINLLKNVEKDMAYVLSLINEE